MPARVALLLLLLGCAEAEPPVPAARATNALLVTVDTLRSDHLGVYGGPVATPHIDALAAEAAVVEHAFTPVPSTGPAMVSLMSGLHPWHHRVLLNAVEPAGDLPSLPDTLQRAGFATGAFVSSYVVGARYGFGRGFDVHHFEPVHGAGGGSGPRAEAWWSRGEPTTTAALAWLDSVREPFFLWVHYMDPHDPYKPPAGFERPEDEPVDLTNKSLSSEVRDFDHLRLLIRYYRGSVVYTDAEVGRLVGALRERGLLERTAVVLTADHGEGLGDHGLLGHGRNLYDELLRVPLIVRGPGIEAGWRRDGAAQLEDLMVTLLSLLGQRAPAGVDGVDLSAWLSGRAARSPREAVVGRRATMTRMPALFYELRGDRKWIGALNGKGWEHALDRDPEELSRLASGGLPPALRAQGEALASKGRPRTLDTESREALGALGYLVE